LAYLASNFKLLLLAQFQVADDSGQSVDGIEPECEIVQGRKVARFQ
jgi:hypothetical protein